jgi:hypothetical protein
MTGEEEEEEGWIKVIDRKARGKQTTRKTKMLVGG